MMIQGHPLSEIIAAIFIILWGIIRFAATVIFIVAIIWLAMQSILLFFFLVTVTALANMKVKW